MPRLPRPAAVLLLLAALGPAARAAEVTPAAADALARDLRGWLFETFGAQAPDSAVQVSAQGDHFALSVPMPGLGSAIRVEGGPLTANARPLDGGRWAIDDLRVPSPYRVTWTPTTDAKDAGAAVAPLVSTFRVREQASRAEWDPSFATPGTLHTSYREMTTETTGPDQQQATAVGRFEGVSTVKPAGRDRVDVVMDGTAEGYAMVQQKPFALRLAAQRMHADGEIVGLARDQVGPVVQAVLQLAGAVTTNRAAGGAVPDLDPKSVHAVLLALRDLATRMRLSQTYEKAELAFAGQTGLADRLAVSMGGEAPGGMLDGFLDLTLDGLRLPDATLGPFGAFLPTHLAMRPVVSGLNLGEALRLATAATEPGADKEAYRPSFAQVVGKDGLRLGLDGFALDVMRAHFSGQGGIVMTTPDAFTGTGRIVATGMDALLDQVKAIPELARAYPGLALLKGIGRTDGDRVTWDLSYQDGKPLVNGLDLTAMAGGGAAPAPRKGPPKR